MSNKEKILNITKQQFIQVFNSSKNLIEIIKYFHFIDSTKVRRYFKEKIKLYDLNLNQHIFQLQHKHVFCQNCGKEFIIKNSQSKRFCSHKCSNSYLAKITSKEKRKFINQKISNALKQNKVVIKDVQLHKAYCKNCKSQLYVKTNSIEIYCHKCSKLLNKHQYMLYTRNGKRIISQQTRQKNRQKTLQCMKLGKIKPWRNRRIISYAQRFFRKVLTNNHIQYITQFPIIGYFLDFFIVTSNGIIDLEIDGKQHWCQKERIVHDRIRDKKLKDLNFIVYRIPWNEINSSHGKEKMRQKINNFLKFFKSLN